MENELSSGSEGVYGKVSANLVKCFISNVVAWSVLRASPELRKVELDILLDTNVETSMICAY